MDFKELAPIHGEHLWEHWDALKELGLPTTRSHVQASLTTQELLLDTTFMWVSTLKHILLVNFSSISQRYDSIVKNFILFTKLYLPFMHSMPYAFIIIFYWCLHFLRCAWITSRKEKILQRFNDSFMFCFGKLWLFYNRLFYLMLHIRSSKLALTSKLDLVWEDVYITF